MVIDKQLHRKFKADVDEILWNEWDPIGVNHAIEARDEYTSYAGAICGKLWGGESKQNILDYLFWAVTDCMGLSGDRDEIKKQNEIIADKIIALFAACQKP